MDEGLSRAQAEIVKELTADVERLVAAHRDIISKYERMMRDPPEWTNFKGDQLVWAREAWFGAAQISRKALGIAKGV